MEALEVISFLKEGIEKLDKANDLAFELGCDGTKTAGYKIALDDVTALISKVCESCEEGLKSSDLETEIRRWRDHYIKVKESGFNIDLRDVEAIAQHFAEWGAEKAKKAQFIEDELNCIRGYREKALKRLEELKESEGSPQYKKGDILYNKNDGSKIEIIAIVADQYKFECGDEYPHYEFFGFIEENYSRSQS